MRFKKNKAGILIILMAICVNSISLSKYNTNMEYQASTKIARAIVELEKDEKMEMEITERTLPLEYHFCINNYNETGINEVAFDYVIEIENSVDNFPVSYTLWDCDNQKEIKLKNGKSEVLRIKHSEKESRKFKLCLQWKELNEDLADNLQIKLKIDVVQSKKGESI